MKAEMVSAKAKRAHTERERYAVDQMAVWHEVDLESARHGVESATSAVLTAQLGIARNRADCGLAALQDGNGGCFPEMVSFLAQEN